MIIIDLVDLIYIVPDLINLFLSGFIFILIYNWITGKNNIDIFIIALWSLIISFIIKNFYSFLHIFFLTSSNINENFKTFIYILTGTAMPFFIKSLFFSKHVSKLAYMSNYKSVNNNIFDDIIDYDKKTMLKIYIKESDMYYLGTFKIIEENGIDSWIALIDYASLNVTNNDIVYCPSKKNINSSVVINMKNIERIEIIYEKDSKVWKWLNLKKETNE